MKNAIITILHLAVVIVAMAMSLKAGISIPASLAWFFLAMAALFALVVRRASRATDASGTGNALRGLCPIHEFPIYEDEGCLVCRGLQEPPR